MSPERLAQILSGQLPARFAFDHPEEGHLLVIGYAAATAAALDVVVTEVGALSADTIPLPEAFLRISAVEELTALPEAEPDEPDAPSR